MADEDVRWSDPVWNGWGWEMVLENLPDHQEHYVDLPVSDNPDEWTKGG